MRKHSGVAPGWLVASAAVALLTLSVACNTIRPITLDDPMLDLHALSGRSIDALTTESIAQLDYSYLPIGDEAEISSPALTLETELPPRGISMAEAVRLVLENSLSLEVGRLDRAIAQDQVRQAYGVFDLMLTAGSSLSHGNRQSGMSIYDPRTGQPIDKDRAVLPETKTHTADGQVGLSQLVDTGGRVGLTGMSSRDKTVGANEVHPNPSYSHQWGLRFDQPLLKDFGPAVTNAGIRIARTNKRLADSQFVRLVMDEISQVMQQYWELVYAVNAARVTVLSKRQAEELLRVNILYMEAEIYTEAQVVQARAQVAAREEQLARDQQLINNLQDDLKRRLRLSPGHEMWNFTLLPLEVPVSEDFQTVDVMAALEDAYRMRPEIEQIRLQGDNLSVTEMVRRNAMLPGLNAFYTHNLTGLDDQYHDAIEEASRSRHNNWSVGVEFSFPLQNRTARYQLRQVEKEIQQLQLNHKALLENIAMDVRATVREVVTAIQRIETARQQITFELRKLSDEEGRLEYGLSTPQEVLRFQEDLAVARQSYLRALIDYNKALISADLARGTILETNNIEMEYGVGPGLQ